MQIVIDIPDEDVPNKQEIMDITLHFIDGEVCECTYPYIVLPKGHGDLIDRSKLVPDCNELEIHDGDDWRNEYCGVSLIQIEQYAEVIVKTDGGVIKE